MYKGKRWDQIFSLFKHGYFTDRPLEQSVIKQRLRHNECKALISSRSTNNVKQCWKNSFPHANTKKAGKVISIFLGLF